MYKGGFCDQGQQLEMIGRFVGLCSRNGTVEDWSFSNLGSICEEGSWQKIVLFFFQASVARNSLA